MFFCLCAKQDTNKLFSNRDQYVTPCHVIAYFPKKQDMQDYPDNTGDENYPIITNRVTLTLCEYPIRFFWFLIW